MTDAEKLLGIINTISMERKVGVFDALIIFAEENNIDIEDIIPVFDANIIEKIKTAVDSIAKSEGYDMVLNRQAVLFTDEKYDISTQVIQQVSKQ